MTRLAKRAVVGPAEAANGGWIEHLNGEAARPHPDHRGLRPCCRELAVDRSVLAERRAPDS